MMTSIHRFLPSELPVAHEPLGTQWITDRLVSVGYTGVLIYRIQEDPIHFYLRVDEENVSKNQLMFDMKPQQGFIRIGATTINVEPGTTKTVEIIGPANSLVQIKFPGVGFITQRSFRMPENGRYNFQFGPCPSNMAVVEPQSYHFYVDNIDVAPALVKVTFR